MVARKKTKVFFLTPTKKKMFRGLKKEKPGKKYMRDLKVGDKVLVPNPNGRYVHNARSYLDHFNTHTCLGARTAMWRLSRQLE